jgi:predicted RNase H-like HicB family nuclease
MALQKQMRIHRCDFWALFEPSKDVEGQWVAHCLSLDVVSQGNSLAHARDMLVEAVGLSIMDDIKAGRSTIKRPSAPKEYWDKLSRIIAKGKRISFAEAIAKGPVSLAASISVTLINENVQIKKNSAQSKNVPPAWLCEVFNRSSTSLRA